MTPFPTEWCVDCETLYEKGRDKGYDAEMFLVGVVTDGWGYFYIY